MFHWLFLLSSATFAFSYPATPDSTKTSGVLCTKADSDYAEDRYAEGIPYCNRNVSTSTKKQIYASYGIPTEEQKDYTIDHLLPLSIGGANDDRNLWPENKAVKATRPLTEWNLYLAIKNGDVTQKEAVDFILRCKFALDTCDVAKLPKAHGG